MPTNVPCPDDIDEQSMLGARFEWVDGALTRAIERGSWVLLDNANLCSSAVLDRLNPLLEPGGMLLLNECGTVGGQARMVVPHPDFRLFLTLDPRCECCSVCGAQSCVQLRSIASAF